MTASSGEAQTTAAATAARSATPAKATIAGDRIERLILNLTIVGVALHPFIVGLFLRRLFFDYTHLTPPGGYYSLLPAHPPPEVNGTITFWAARRADSAGVRRGDAVGLAHGAAVAHLRPVLPAATTRA